MNRYFSSSLLCLFTVGSALLSLPIPVHSDFPMATPESQGLSSESLNELGDVVQFYFDNEMIVGAELLVIKNRCTVFHQAYGWMDREKRKSMALNSIFNVRSMTKPFTGAAAQMLIDEGKLQLDDPVANYLPGFDNDKSKAITIEQLLTHRSGLPLSLLMDLNFDYKNLFELGDAAGINGPIYPPGSKFWYSDAGSESLGAVVEIVSGQPLDEFITERLLIPLGMNDSFSFNRESSNDPLWDRVCSLYVGFTGDWTKIWEPAGQSLYPFVFGSQSLYSTPMDYAHFLAMWMDGGLTASDERILSNDAIERTLTPVSEMTSLGSNVRSPCGFDGLWAFYGQMSVLYVPSEHLSGAKAEIIGHSGSDGTIAMAWPELDLIICYFTQSRNGLTAIKIQRDIDRLLINPGKTPTIPEEYMPYVGVYQANSGAYRGMEFTVFVFNGNLAVDIPNILFFELQEPTSAGFWKFTMDPSAYITFEEDTDGIVTGMRFHEPGATRYLTKIQTTQVDNWWLY